MRNLILCFSLLVAACGSGNTNAAPSDPSSSNASAPGTTSASPSSSSSTTSTGETKPPEGKCGQTVTTSATALDACMTECEKLSDKAPEGSRCLPPKTECKMGCDHKFKNAK